MFNSPIQLRAPNPAIHSVRSLMQDLESDHCSATGEEGLTKRCAQRADLVKASLAKNR